MNSVYNLNLYIKDTFSHSLRCLLYTGVSVVGIYNRDHDNYVLQVEIKTKLLVEISM